jgi:hypothetical protein
MRHDLPLIRSALEKIVDGGEISSEEIQGIPWDTTQELQPLAHRIFRELQMFASDLDLRTKDSAYDASWRKGIAKLLQELDRKMEDGSAAS